MGFLSQESTINHYTKVFPNRWDNFCNLLFIEYNPGVKKTISRKSDIFPAKVIFWGQFPHHNCINIKVIKFSIDLISKSSINCVAWFLPCQINSIWKARSKIHQRLQHHYSRWLERCLFFRRELRKMPQQVSSIFLQTFTLHFSSRIFNSCSTYTYAYSYAHLDLIEGG